MIDADYELAARLQSQEQEELTTKEKSKLFVELMDKRKKHFARPKREEQRTKPPTKAQKRNTKMLQNIDREDLETLWKLVKAKHGLTRPEEGYERVLWGDLKVMFEPDIESEVWRNLQGHKVTVWKLFSSTVGRIVGIKRLHDDQELILLSTTAQPLALLFIVTTAWYRLLLLVIFSVALHGWYYMNGVAERRNRTLLKATRTMLVDSKLPSTFWAEAINTACYVLNRVLVIKPHTNTPYELIHGRTPLIDFMKPFGCPITILNTMEHLGKFDGKADEGFFVGYSVVSKAMRVFNKRTKIVEETLNIRFLENAPNVTGNGLDWLFDVDYLTKSMNYVPVVVGNQTNGIAGTRDNIVTGQAEKKTEPEQEYILIPFYITDPLISQGPKDSEEDSGMKPTEVDESGASDKDGEDDQATRSEFEMLLQQEKQTVHPNNTNSINTVSTPVNVPNVSPIDDNTGIFAGAYDDEDVGGQADLNNLETTMNVSPIPIIRIDKDHPKEHIIRDLNSVIQTRIMTKISDEHAMVSYINKQRRTNNKDYQNCLFACFLSQMEPKKVIQALEDPNWIEAMQEELLQFQLQKVWTLVDLPNGNRAIGTK
ncbi:putative ribonuclease H-like domain-containing protein [Tanacetum coccineum]